jgi:hypothetical protein
MERFTNACRDVRKRQREETKSTDSATEKHPSGLKVEEKVAEQKRGHDRERRRESFQNVVRILHHHCHDQAANSLWWREGMSVDHDSNLQQDDRHDDTIVTVEESVLGD